MKKILGLIIFVLSFSCTSVMAQENKTKVKPLTTNGDKVHNVFHPRHKRHHGYKSKHKTATHKRKVYVKPKETKVETKH